MTPAEKVVAALEDKPELLREVLSLLRLKGHIMPHISPEPDWGPARLAARFAKPVPSPESESEDEDESEDAEPASDERYSFRQSLCDGCGDRPHPHRDCL